MRQFLPLLVLALLLVIMITFTRRNRQRAAAADVARSQQLGPGSQVMTTSGLYATVVRMNDDGTAVLSVADGVEVRWAVAALRLADELPQRYRGPIGDAETPAKDVAATRVEPVEPEQG
ncbi:MAG TPA: preprotein translocase subunit YajC [Jatrophihabitans sp.]|nr:preprotein translocase subunit YajC [Jatrophihabitans sp.]